MAIHSGFFNALSSVGTYDRVYDADDYSANMGAIISDGVRRSGDNDLKVSASGLVLKVSIGRAWIQGHWINNDTEYTVTTVTPPTGTSRIDGVFVRLDTNTSVRSMSIVYRTGTFSAAPECIRSGSIYELMLAKVNVAVGATNLTVTDMRADEDVCGWVRSPVGYDDYFESLDSAFNDWFDAMKGQLSTDAAGNLQNQISQQNKIISKYAPVELYKWDVEHDSEQNSTEHFVLSQSALNFDTLEIEYCVKRTLYNQLTSETTIELSETKHVVHVEVPESIVNRIDVYLDVIDYEAVYDPENPYLCIINATYAIPASNPNWIFRLLGPQIVPSTATTNNDIRISRVLGYGNRNAPPIVSYNETQADALADNAFDNDA